jgi:cytidine deaminase
LADSDHDDDGRPPGQDWHGANRRQPGDRRSGKERRRRKERRKKNLGPPASLSERRRGADRRQGDRRAGRDRRTEEGWLAISIEETTAPAFELEHLLVAAAREARERARAPYSGFRVGAALETIDGQLITGCNIENASYGLTVCAERVALLKALSEGHEVFTRIAVVADTERATPPCGPCRQLLWEYCGDIQVVLASLKAVKGRYQLARLLPLPFDRRLLGSE